ncbi:MAG: YIP1 family protein [Terriglobales bacterium]
MSSPAITTPEPPLSEGARLINTFIAPSKTFTDIRRNASWWVPWLLMSVFSIGFMFTVGQKIGYEDLARKVIATSRGAEQFESLPAEQQNQRIQLTAKIMKFAGYASPLSLLLVAVIVAALLMALFNFGAGAEVPFKQSMAIVLYSWLPSLLSSVLAIVSIVIGSANDIFKEGFNLQNPVATNPAYFMDPTKNKFLYGMASSLYVFAIWIIILMGIGFSSVSKVKKGTAIAMVAGAYIVFKLITSGIAAI